MADARQLEILKNGVQLWNKWAWFEQEIVDNVYGKG